MNHLPVLVLFVFGVFGSFFNDQMLEPYQNQVMLYESRLSKLATDLDNLKMELSRDSNVMDSEQISLAVKQVAAIEEKIWQIRDKIKREEDRISMLESLILYQDFNTEIAD